MYYSNMLLFTKLAFSARSMGHQMIINIIGKDLLDSLSKPYSTLCLYFVHN